MPSTRWLDDDEQDAWMALAAMMFTLPTAFDSQLQRDEDLTLADYMVLAMLSDRGSSAIRMTELAAASSTSQSRLSRIVARLEASGYVTRSMASDDRRAVVAQLTPVGRKKMENAAPGHVETVRELVIDRLTPEQLISLASIGRSVLGSACPTSSSVRER